jgi:opacity protein-like surface antigen
LSQAALAESSQGLFIKPYIGFSQLSDTSAKSTSVGTMDGDTDINLDSGFVAGLGFGYQYNPQWAVELAWEYRTNDSETTLADGEAFKQGNYASNLFFLNGYYSFAHQGNWTPYLGAGVSWAQEIDIDLEKAGVEQSFSGDNDFGYQVFAGTYYSLNEALSLNGEFRYGSIKSIELEQEGGNGTLEDLDYDSLSLQLGVLYHF